MIQQAGNSTFVSKNSCQIYGVSLLVGWMKVRRQELNCVTEMLSTLVNISSRIIRNVSGLFGCVVQIKYIGEKLRTTNVIVCRGLVIGMRSVGMDIGRQRIKNISSICLKPLK